MEDEELTRIFVMIPKSFTEEDLKETFKVFSDGKACEYVNVKCFPKIKRKYILYKGDEVYFLDQYMMFFPLNNNNNIMYLY